MILRSRLHQVARLEFLKLLAQQFLGAFPAHEASFYIAWLHDFEISGIVAHD